MFGHEPVSTPAVREAQMSGDLARLQSVCYSDVFPLDESHVSISPGKMTATLDREPADGLCSSVSSDTHPFTAEEWLRVLGTNQTLLFSSDSRALNNS